MATVNRRSEILTTFPLITTTWGEWIENNPDSYVLSLDTGYKRNYDGYPYEEYIMVTLEHIR